MLRRLRRLGAEEGVLRVLIGSRRGAGRGDPPPPEASSRVLSREMTAYPGWCALTRWRLCRPSAWGSGVLRRLRRRCAEERLRRPGKELFATSSRRFSCAALPPAMAHPRVQ